MEREESGGGNKKTPLFFPCSTGPVGVRIAVSTSSPNLLWRRL